MTQTSGETYRATLRARTPDGDWHTLIILRRGLGHAARVWLTFDGSIRTTAVMTDAQAADLMEKLTKARTAAV